MTRSDAQAREMPRADRQARTRELLAAARNATGTERSRLIDEVVLANMSVARSIAGRYRNRGVPTEDLEQIGYLALLRAARRFDPAKSDDFLTFAVPTITGEVKRYFRDHGWMVRPPRRIQDIQAAVNAEAARAEDRTGTVGALAARLGLPESDVREALQANGCFHPTPLDVDGSAAERWLADDEHDHEAAEARVLLGSLVTELAPRDRLILYLRFFEGRTQSEIGEELGVTQMQVSRLLMRILRDLRQRAESDASQVA